MSNRVFGKDQQEQQQQLIKVLKCLEVTLNQKKCEFNKTSIKFLGHVIDHNGIRPDPDKTEAICRMEPPKSMSDLRRFLGMVYEIFSQIDTADARATKRAWLWGS